MTESPPEELPQEVSCVHCDATHTLQPGDDPDWLCQTCERYQDTMICTACHSVVRTSLVNPAGSS